MAIDSIEKERTTEQMLSEISCGTAADIVLAARYANAPPGQTFIPDMDEIIRASRGNEISSLRRGDMVEIIGPSGSGKTSLLLFLALTRVLPPSITLDLPGPSSDPITINLGGRSDYITLISPTTHRSPMTILHKRLKSHIEGHVLDTLTSLGKSRKIGIVLETTISVHVEDALKRVRLVRVKPRWKSFYLGLKQIIDPPHLVVPTGGTTSKDEELRVDMLLIDGFSDPFWPERWKSEQRGFEKKSDRVKSSDDVGLRDVVSLLETIRRELGSVIVLTLQALWDGLFATHLQPPYPAPFAPDREDNRQWPLNIQITLKGRKMAQQRPADELLVDALRDEAKMKRGDDDSQCFLGVVRVPGGIGPAATAQGVKFDLYIGSTGVEVWEQS